MSKNENRAKDKKDRLEQKEKIDAETQRSLAVAEMKKAHKLIEETEKTRKRPAMQSVCFRIDVHIKILSRGIALYGRAPFAEKPILAENALDGIKSNYQVYESIRHDFQRTLGISDEEMNVLFPNIELKMKDGHSAASSLAQTYQQLVHMKIYCQRMLV